MWKKRKKKGFTLAEMLLTIGILTVLVGISVSGYVTFQNTSTYKHYNETAETIFTIVQSELVASRANHSLEQWAKKVTETALSLNGQISGITQDDGNPTSMDYIYSGYNGGEQNEIYTFYEKLGPWESGENEEGGNLLTSLLKRCFLEGDYNTILKDSYVCVELDPREGLVYSVFYSKDNVDGIWNYGDSSSPLCDRQKTARYKRGSMVGYYGVHQLSMSTSLKVEQPKIVDLELRNEETLSLQFSVDLRGISSAVGQLTYQVELYDAENNADPPFLSMLLNTEERRLPSSGDGLLLTDVVATDLNGNNADMCFPAWIDSQGKVTVVLDVIDYAASSVKNLDAYASFYEEIKENKKDLCSILEGYQDANQNPIKDCFSMYRLGLSGRDKIYCTVKGAGMGYTTTEINTSNRSYCGFASCSVEENATEGTKEKIYAISNFRHLFNVRFEEILHEQGFLDDSEDDQLDLSEKSYLYQIQDTLNWKEFCLDQRKSDFDSNIGYIYDSGKRLEKPVNLRQEDLLLLWDDEEAEEGTTGVAFLPIPWLHEDSVLEVKDEEKLESLYISDENPTFSGADEDGQADRMEAAGLVAVNGGTIRNLTLSGVTVKGSQGVGAFCGVNAGTLLNLKVENEENAPSRIEGETCVGGIFGRIDSSRSSQTEILLENLENYAPVSGRGYVGGIGGLVSSERNEDDGAVQVILKNCINYGAMKIASLSGESEGDGAGAGFLGGMLGLAVHTEDAGEDGGIRLEGCYSIPLLKDVSEENLEEWKNGICVGGLLGAAYRVELHDCAARMEQEEHGIVTGEKFVGGIAGIFMGGDLLGIEGEDSFSENAADVYGKTYVGGILGCNADVYISESGAEKMPLEQWLSDSISNESDDAPFWGDILLAAAESLEAMDEPNVEHKIVNWMNKGNVEASGDYVGGITGYNTGWLINCNNLSRDDQTYPEVKSTEGNYAGGITGYNNGILGNSYEKTEEGYTHSEESESHGTISVTNAGYGHDYVGGIVGYNDKEAVIEDYVVSGSSVKESENTSDEKTPEENASEENAPNENSAGEEELFEVHATGNYTGGLAGYNGGRIEVPDEILVKITSEGDYVGGLIGSNEGELHVNSSENPVHVTVGWTEEGEPVYAEFTACTVKGSVSGENYVGGIVGEDLGGSFSDLISDVSVTANGENVAGIAGICHEETNIKNCLNKGAITAEEGDVAGIVVKNSGTIENCINVGNVQSVKGKAGGICVYNTSEAKIINCRVGYTVLPDEAGMVMISGNQAVGGFSAENEGSITGGVLRNLQITNDADNSEKSVLGSATGENKGEILLSGNVGAYSGVFVKVMTNGADVGGISGKNSGVIQSEEPLAEKKDLDDSFGASNEEQTNAGEEISIHISAGEAVTTVNIGGIAGANAAEGSIQKIKVADDRFDEGFRTFPGDSETGFGGIAGTNAGEILECSFSGNLSVGGNSDGIANVGGIAGKNLESGSITECTIGNEKETMIESTGFGYVGGIIGWNQGTVFSCDNQEISKELVTISVNQGQAGGIVGFEDHGSCIYGTEEKPLSTGKNWIVLNKGSFSNAGIGGIVGFFDSGNREQEISYIKNYAKVESTNEANNTAVGGIVGHLQNQENNSLTLRYCLNEGEMTGKGSAGGIVGGVTSDTVLSLQGCVNAGNITYGMNGVNNCGGGMVGYGNESLGFYRCRNYGSVQHGTGQDARTPGISHFYSMIQDCFDFRKMGSYLVVEDYGTKDAEKIDDSYYYSGELDEAEQNAVLEGYPEDTKLAVDGNPVHKMEYTAKLGYPISVLNLENGFAYSSYEIWSEKGNPLFEYGIPGNQDPVSVLEMYETENVYESIEKTREDLGVSLIQRYYDTKDRPMDKTRTKVRGLKLTVVGDVLKATWIGLSKADGYKLCFEFVLENGHKTYRTLDRIRDTQWSMKLEEEYYGGNMTVYVRGAGEDEEIEASHYLSDDDGYAWSSATKTLNSRLPEPEVSLELGAYRYDAENDQLTKEGTGAYVAVLENTEAYDQILDDGETTLIQVYVNPAEDLENQTETYQIAYTKGNLKSAYSTQAADPFGSSDTPNQFYLRARRENYSDSGLVSRQFRILSAKDLGSKAIAETDFLGFAGTNPFDLSYALQTELLKNGGRDSYTADVCSAAEFLTKTTLASADGDYQISEVAIAYKENALTAEENAAKIVFTGFPEELMELPGSENVGSYMISARTYPWKGQNDDYRMGHAVTDYETGKSEFTAEELLHLTDWKRNGAEILKKASDEDLLYEPNPGYTIHQKESEIETISYEVWYTPMLDDTAYAKIQQNKDSYFYQTDRKNQNGKISVRQVVFGQNQAGTNTTGVQPVPEELELAEIEKDVYQLQWKSSAEDYQVQLLGFAENGNQIFLQVISDAVKEGDTWRGLFVDTEGSWNYERMKVKLISMGESDGSYTNVLPSYVEKEMEVISAFEPEETGFEEAFETPSYSSETIQLSTPDLEEGHIQQLLYEIYVIEEGKTEEKKLEETIRVDQEMFLIYGSNMEETGVRILLEDFYQIEGEEPTEEELKHSAVDVVKDEQGEYQVTWYEDEKDPEELKELKLPKELMDSEELEEIEEAEVPLKENLSDHEEKKLRFLSDESLKKLSKIGKIYELPYKRGFINTRREGYDVMEVDIPAWLIIGKDGILRLILPDNAEQSKNMLDILNHTGSWTWNLIVQNIRSSEEVRQYIDSLGILWKRKVQPGYPAQELLEYVKTPKQWVLPKPLIARVDDFEEELIETVLEEKTPEEWMEAGPEEDIPDEMYTELDPFEEVLETDGEFAGETGITAPSVQETSKPEPPVSDSGFEDDFFFGDAELDFLMG